MFTYCLLLLFIIVYFYFFKLSDSEIGNALIPLWDIVTKRGEQIDKWIELHSNTKTNKTPEIKLQMKFSGDGDKEEEIEQLVVQAQV